MSIHQDTMKRVEKQATEGRRYLHTIPKRLWGRYFPRSTSHALSHIFLCYGYHCYRMASSPSAPGLLSGPSVGVMWESLTCVWSGKARGLMPHGDLLANRGPELEDMKERLPSFMSQVDNFEVHFTWPLRRKVSVRLNPSFPWQWLALEKPPFDWLPLLSFPLRFPRTFPNKWSACKPWPQALFSGGNPSHPRNLESLQITKKKICNSIEQWQDMTGFTKKEI